MLNTYSCLLQILEVCLRLGVKCVSVYAFAIDNFKRPQSEVDALMSLAISGVTELFDEQCVSR